MASVNPVAFIPSQYYSLPNRRGVVNAVGNSSQVVTAFPGAGIDSRFLGFGTASPDGSLLDIADLVDLSPQARNYLDFFNGAVSGMTGGGVLADGAGFILSDEQQERFDSIIADYRDAPFTAETYNSILNDLSAAGLGPDQLAILQFSTSNSINLSQLLLNALNWQNSQTDFLSMAPPTDQQHDMQAYTRQIFSEWERISTRFNPNDFALLSPNRF